METTKNKWKKLIVLALVFIICLFSLVRCRNLTYIAVENQVYGSLKDVALQNEVMIERELNTTSNFLANIASLPQYTEADLNSEETIKSLVNSLKITFLSFQPVPLLREQPDKLHSFFHIPSIWPR